MFSSCTNCTMWRRRTNFPNLPWLSLPRPPRYSIEWGTCPLSRCPYIEWPVFKMPSFGSNCLFKCFPFSKDDKNTINIPPGPNNENAAISTDSKRILEVKNVDPLLRINGEEHHTYLFELMWRKENPQLVIRRGQPFNIKITLSRPFAEEYDSMSFVFTLKDCKQPSLGQGTLIAVPLEKKDRFSKDKRQWHAEIDSISANIIEVKITPGVNCLIGKYTMDIDTKLSQNLTLNYNYRGLIYVLFNPWDKSDEVYMRDIDECNEYVMNESGLMYRGTYSMQKPSPWKYSQFEQDVLDCAIHLYNETSKIPYSYMNDPVKITRALSAAVNSQDDSGVLVGNWTDDNSRGVTPTSWTGSMKILQKFYKNKKSVRYAQCWVFAGVLTTVCRALGIPTRPVTCFEAGHDTKGSLTVDIYYDEDGNHMDEIQQESIWNFHVWTEVYMKRFDIGKEFSGWQVIDSTPQELSDTQFKCGPASVTAVKSGLILKPFDVDFVYSEVNADVVYWKYTNPTEPLKLIKTDIARLGKLIITKAVGSWDKDDITANYKHPEGTNTERQTMINALKKSGNSLSRIYLNENFNDIKFDLKLIDDIIIGSTFNISLKMLNKNAFKDYRVIVHLSVASVTYTGRQRGNIKKIQKDVKVDKKTGEEVNMMVTYNEYASKLVDQPAFVASCFARVIDTDFEYYAEDDFRVRQPDIKMIVSGDPIAGKPVTIKASFKNPLPITIKKGYLSIDGPGIVDKSKLKIINAPAHEEISGVFTLKPQYPGDHTIVAKFVSKELTDVDGRLSISVN